jgi:hypothetical protein
VEDSAAGEEVGLGLLGCRAGAFDLVGFLAAGSLLGVFLVGADRCFLADGISALSSDLRLC